MVRVSWGGEVVIADLAHVGEDGGNGGEGGHSLPTNGIPTSTTPQALTPTASATPSETPTISPAPTVSTPPTVSPPPRAPTAMVEGLSDGDESAVSTSFSDDHRSLRDDLRDDFSSPRPRSPRRRLEKRPLSKVTEDDNNNGNGDGNGNGDKSANSAKSNGDVTLSKDEYRRFLTLKGSPPDSQKPPEPSAPPPDDEILTSVDRMLATLSDLEDDLEPIDGVDTESDADSDEAEARRELLTDRWRQLFDKDISICVSSSSFELTPEIDRPRPPALTLLRNHNDSGSNYTGPVKLVVAPCVGVRLALPFKLTPSMPFPLTVPR
ncbi:hypothetical protein E2C01_025398 [Portunus trituberculatus]|uniref:Uncharacterized protein n=1 Tax=Portunus trituberculatus TaxID=210409 RepID=A0A5B7EFE6_PORTR|nr:hypothetical protein [Portunus trituberculatus]